MNGLKDRQIKILTAAASGMLNWESAELLNLPEATVRAELNDTIRLLGARNVTHAVALAISRGIIQFEEA
jgi:DNA-binding NarL/FixJ family response regulator